MNDGLTKDEFDALEQISRAPNRGRATACVARNSKRLAGLKYVAYGKEGHLEVTEKGKQTLFVKSCIDGLRAVSTDPHTKLKVDVATFLGKKGYITPKAPPGGFDITQRGLECLADIEATGG